MSYNWFLSNAVWPYDVKRQIGEVKYRILANDKVGVIAIAGTDSVRDFLAWNTDTKIREILNFKFHKGFAGYAETIVSDLRGIDDLPEVFASGDWFCTGHSLGAAAAGILPYLLHAEAVPKIEIPCGVLGVGCPNFAVGATSCSSPLRNTAFIASRWDVVAHVPIGFTFRQWCRPPVEYWVDDSGLSTWNGNQIARIAWYAWQLASVSINTMFLRRPHLQALEEHSLSKYHQRIKSAMLGLEVTQ